jgi:hypothetical protein
MAFGIDVKLFAINSRREGKGWGEIKRAIKDRFNIERAPTTRSLQKWEKETDSEVLEHAIKEKTKKEAEAAKGRTITSVAEDLLPRLWKARGAGEDIEYVGWSWFFSMIESTLGSVKFEKFLERYLEERRGKPEIPPTPIETTQTH